ncbi:MAG: S8 family serine peptidase [Anaerolineae bacterium]
MMTERKHSGTPGGRAWLLLVVSLFFSMEVLSLGSIVRADTPTPAPTPGKPTGWGTTMVASVVAPSDVGRSPGGNPKLGSSLNQLLEAYHRGGLAEAQAFAGSHNLVLQDDCVQVKIVTTEEAIANVRDAVKAVGGEYQTYYQNLLQALVPIGELEALVGRPDVQIIRKPQQAIPLAPLQVGGQTSEGVAASGASAWHAAGYTGTGVRVAVIDVGFSGYAALLGTDLPASVTTRDYTGTFPGTSPHGTANAEIVYDMAYGADMYLVKIATDVDLGSAVNWLIGQGVDVISMSVSWLLDGPGDGTGNLANIVNNAHSNGIFFATAAGNGQEVNWHGIANIVSGLHVWNPTSDQNINYFGPGNGRAYIIPAGYTIQVGLHWDDWTAVTQDYNMELYRWTGSTWRFVAGSYNTQNGGAGQTPEEYISINAPTTAPYGVIVRNSSTTRNCCLRLCASHTLLHLDEWVPSCSLTFPADSPDVMAVGAVDVTTYVLEPYSSQGSTLGPGGSCSGSPIKPDITAYANVSTVTYGPGGFGGTSSVTPHVAGAAALVKDAYPSYGPTEIQAFLEGRTSDLGDPGKDNLYGAGRLNLGGPTAVTLSSFTARSWGVSFSFTAGASRGALYFWPWLKLVGLAALAVGKVIWMKRRQLDLV